MQLYSTQDPKTSMNIFDFQKFYYHKSTLSTEWVNPLNSQCTDIEINDLKDNIPDVARCTVDNTEECYDLDAGKYSNALCTEPTESCAALTIDNEGVDK